MNPILVAVLASLLAGVTACSGARASGKPARAAAQHTARGDSPWLEDVHPRRAAADEGLAAGSGDESEPADEGGDDQDNEGSDDLGDEGSDDPGGEDGEDSSIDFGDEDWSGDEDWEDEGDQGNG